MKSPKGWKMGHVGSKTRSLGQISEKPCVHSRFHIFSPIIMKRGQNVCLYKILDEIENGLFGVNTRSRGHILEKPLVCSRGHIFSLINIKPDQNACLEESWDKFESWSCWVKN